MVTYAAYVFLAWQNPSTRKVLPIGRLAQLGSHEFEFAYVQGALDAVAEDFTPLLSFPDFNRIYRGDELPPLFRNRVLSRSRPDYPEYVQQLGLAENASAIEQMSRSGGRRVTDALEVFSAPTPRPAGGWQQHLLVRGVRYIPDAESAISDLNEGEQLLVMRDEQNPHGAHARLLRTDGTRVVGFLPDYLALELEEEGVESSQLTVTVERVNPAPALVQQRLLCRVEYFGDRKLFTGEKYQPICAGASTVAA
jgi:hypothetical protein